MAVAYEVNVTTGEIIERERTEQELADEAVEQAKLAKAQEEAKLLLS